jgi:hypothetical protein
MCAGINRVAVFLAMIVFLFLYLSLAGVSNPSPGTTYRLQLQKASSGHL